MLVNNAAVTHDALLMLTNEAAWDRVLDDEPEGRVPLQQGRAPRHDRGKWGRIVNVVSPAAFFGKEGAATYAASKGGLVALTKSLAREVARYGITVNAVSPGLVETQLDRGHVARAARGRRSAHPARASRHGRRRSRPPSSLASPAAAYVTGTTLHVDGGLTML